MAERSNAKKTQDGGPDVGMLQKRSRRRLVGAIALVLLAVIVLPMVFDPEPRPTAPLVSVRIPAESGSKFTPKEAPGSRAAPLTEAPDKPAGTPPAAAPIAPPSAGTPAPGPVDVQASAPAPAPAQKAKASDKAPVPVPAAAAGEFMVQVGAFASSDTVREVLALLKGAKIPHFTETVATAGGTVTRVRIGPFATRDGAEKASDRVQKLGQAKGLNLKPANPVAR